MPKQRTKTKKPKIVKTGTFKQIAPFSFANPAPRYTGTKSYTVEEVQHFASEILKNHRSIGPTVVDKIFVRYCDFVYENSMDNASSLALLIALLTHGLKKQRTQAYQYSASRTYALHPVGTWVSRLLSGGIIAHRQSYGKPVRFVIPWRPLINPTALFNILVHISNRDSLRAVFGRVPLKGDFLEAIFDKLCDPNRNLITKSRSELTRWFKERALKTGTTYAGQKIVDRMERRRGEMLKLVNALGPKIVTMDDELMMHISIKALSRARTTSSFAAQLARKVNKAKKFAEALDNPDDPVYEV